MRRMIERLLHETRERDRPLAPESVADARKSEQVASSLESSHRLNSGSAFHFCNRLQPAHLPLNHLAFPEVCR